MVSFTVSFWLLDGSDLPDSLDNKYAISCRRMIQPYSFLNHKNAPDKKLLYLSLT